MELLKLCLDLLREVIELPGNVRDGNHVLRSPGPLEDDPSFPRAGSEEAIVPESALSVRLNPTVGLSIGRRHFPWPLGQRHRHILLRSPVYEVDLHLVSCLPFRKQAAEISAPFDLIS